jgi:sulfite reductase (NADPH) flavoprotein alpha-component
MGTGVHQALVDILGENDLQQLIETNRYRRDVY